MHKIEIPASITTRVYAIRDGLHMFEEIEPAKTAHLIIDLQNGFMAPGVAVEIVNAREIVPNVNRISTAVRAAGGLNVFVQYAITEQARREWTNWFKYYYSPKRRAEADAAFTEGTFGWELWPGLDIQDGDIIVPKTRFGAFVPGSSDLHEILQARGIDTLIITGTTSNVCCESTARDAMQMNYKVIFVADGTATNTDSEHNATLGNMTFLFADVMMTEEVLACLAKVTPAK